jgi:Ca-activated chloride channel family protein
MNSFTFQYFNIKAFIFTCCRFATQLERSSFCLTKNLLTYRKVKSFTNYIFKNLTSKKAGVEGGKVAQMIKKIRLFVVLFLSFNLSYAQIDKEKLIEGNQSYKENKYGEAEKKYQQAIASNSKSYEGNYNLGNSLYKQKKTQNAREFYEKSLKNSTNNEQKAQANYNIGNTFLEEKNYKQAEKYFKEALKKNPNDEQIRYNYAFSKKKLNEEKQQQQQQQQEENKEKENQQKNKNKKEQPENKDNKENKQQKQDNSKGTNPKDNPTENKNEQLTKNNVDKEFYDQLLEALKEQEQRTHKRVINSKEKMNTSQNSKNW